MIMIGTGTGARARLARTTRAITSRHLSDFVSVRASSGSVPTPTFSRISSPRIWASSSRSALTRQSLISRQPKRLSLQSSRSGCGKPHICSFSTIITMEKEYTRSRSKTKFYAVGVGRETGIYNTWSECEQQIKRYPGAKFKSFPTREEAVDFVQRHRSTTEPTDTDHATTTTTPTTSTVSTDTTKYDKKRKAVDRVDNIPATIEEEEATDDDDLTTPNNELVKVLIMFDGGSRGNPGSAGAGALVNISAQKDGKSTQKTSSSTATVYRSIKKIRIRHYLDEDATNNEAEYCGLCKGLETTLEELRAFQSARRRSLGAFGVHVVVQGDSQLIIKQLTKQYQCKHPMLRRYLDKARSLVDEISKICILHIDYQHVYRENNSVADGLANQAMDAKRSWVSFD